METRLHWQNIQQKENFDENQKNKRFIVMNKHNDSMKNGNSIRTINFNHVKTNWKYSSRKIVIDALYDELHILTCYSL